MFSIKKDMKEIMESVDELIALAENEGDEEGLHLINISNNDEDENLSMFILMVAFGVLAYVFALLIVVEAIGPHPFSVVIGLMGFGSFLIILGTLFIMLRLRKRSNLNKLASLIVSSELRRISDIVHHSGLPEQKVINYLRILVADSSGHKLGNDARYLKGAKINLQTMEITLSDKYVEKSDWTCVYCRAVNPPTSFNCHSCHAPKKKL